MSIDAHTARTLYDQLVKRGFEPDAEAQRLYAAMTTKQTPDALLEQARAELRAAIVDGDEDRIDAAQDAVGQASNVRAAWETFEQARRELAGELMRHIREPAFAHVAKLYGATGKRFAEVVATGQVDADPGTVMVAGTVKEREAWAAVPSLVAELESLAHLLSDIVRTRHANYRDAQDSKYARWPLALLTDVQGADLDKLVKAWCWQGYHPAPVNAQPPNEIDRACMGRGGRWSALVRFGAALRVPCETVAQYEPLGGHSPGFGVQQHGPLPKLHPSAAGQGGAA